MKQWTALGSALARLPFKQTYSQVDAAEVLNLDALQIRRVIAVHELSFQPDGVALVTRRDPVLHLAKRYIATAEIALRSETKFINVPPVDGKLPKREPLRGGLDQARFRDDPWIPLTGSR